MKKYIIKNHVIITIILAALASCSKSIDSKMTDGKTASDSQGDYYTCPMHPQVKSDEKGFCPICNMALMKMSSVDFNPKKSELAADRHIKFYRHPMNPSVHSEHPAKDNMGMDYIPVFDDEITKQSRSSSKRSEVVLSDQQEILSGIHPVEVKIMKLSKEILVPGRALSESQISFQVFEEDMNSIKIGQGFIAKSASFSGIEMEGTITSVESILDPMTRTLRVNGALKKSARLRPESSVSGKILVQLGDVVVVPEDSVMQTGDQDLVFVSSGEGRYRPQSVKLGIKTNGFYEVKEGLKAGTFVSSGPNFLIDSEARIRGTYDSQDH